MPPFANARALFQASPAFRQVFLSDLITQAGDAGMMVALPLLAGAGTGHLGLAGAVLAVEVASYGLSSLPAGHWADRVSPKPLMLGAHFTRALALLAALALTPGPWTPAVLLLLALVMGVAGAVYQPARAAFMRRLLAGEQLQAAVALDGVAAFLVRLAAPAAMAGIVQWFSPRVGLGVDLGTLLGGLLCLGLPWVQGSLAPEPAAPEDQAWWAGARWVLRAPGLAAVLALDAGQNIAGMAAWPITLAFLVRTAGAPAAANGYMLAITGLAGALGARWAGGHRPRSREFLAWAALLATAYLAAASLQAFVALAAVWLVRGFALGAFGVRVQQRLASSAPAALMGRVQAAWGLVGCLACTLGAAGASQVLEVAGPAGAFACCGLVIALPALAGLWARETLP